jgi:serine/threonine-protein kinase PpkA
VEKGYLYRDIKPENVLIGKNGLARLFDFGLCLSLEEAANPDDEVATFAGSPLFVPPERVVGDPEGEFSDIYTLGLLFFNILSGRTYYTADEMLELVKKHVTAIRISSTGFKLKHCTEHTVAVLDKMIQRDPEDRYQTFRELIPDIQQAARDLHLS